MDNIWVEQWRPSRGGEEEGSKRDIESLTDAIGRVHTEGMFLPNSGEFEIPLSRWCYICL